MPPVRRYKIEMFSFSVIHYRILRRQSKEAIKNCQKTEPVCSAQTGSVFLAKLNGVFFDSNYFIKLLAKLTQQVEVE